SGSPGFQKFNIVKEIELRKRLDAFPSGSELFYDSEGHMKQPDDAQLKEAAELAAISRESRVTIWDFLKLTDEQRELYFKNSQDLQQYYNSGREVLDKIPSVDQDTGAVTWRVVRKGDKESWERLWYYGYVPIVAFMALIYMFKEDSSVGQWAVDELRLRAAENAGDNDEALASMTDAERKRRDALVVERILSGDYEKLTGTK
ncbi:hypothetical protein CANCADRAFT_20169, partial [Tortispora caseinolytica NRRL Y-17796]